jgi:hypothetical protein
VGRVPIPRPFRGFQDLLGFYRADVTQQRCHQPGPAGWWLAPMPAPLSPWSTRRTARNPASGDLRGTSSPRRAPGDGRVRRG